MKKLFLLFGAMSALALSSCGGTNVTEESEKKTTKSIDSVKTFAVDVATKINKNQKDLLLALYPDVEKADSLALSFVADNIIVERKDSANYLAKFDEGKEFSIAKDAQGTMTVTQSKGLFVYPEKDFDFAKRTGMWTDSLTDAQFAERMATMEDFRKYLINTIDTYTPIVVKNGRLESYEAVPGTSLIVCTQKFIVTNGSDKPISGHEYKVLITYHDNIKGSCNTTKKGRDLAPKASTTYEVEYSGIGGGADCKIIYNTSKAQQFEKNFKPNGDEYQKFLNTKKK